MGLFDKKPNTIGFPQNNSEIKPAFPEPPESIDEMDDLGSVKNSVETPMPESDFGVDEADALQEDLSAPEPMIATQNVASSFNARPMESSNPILYIKLSEYKEVVQATNKMRKDIEKAKSIISDLRMIEKDEHSKLEKSDELIKEVENIISLFEKVMVTPIE